MIVNAIAGMVAQQWPATAYTTDEKAAAATVLVPVFVKYHITPAWLERYREEFAVVWVWGGLGVKGYQRARAARPAAKPGGGVGLDDEAKFRL
jgi:hypothetical protein